MAFTAPQVMVRPAQTQGETEEERRRRLAEEAMVMQAAPVADTAALPTPAPGFSAPTVAPRPMPPTVVPEQAPEWEPPDFGPPVEPAPVPAPTPPLFAPSTMAAPVHEPLPELGPEPSAPSYQPQRSAPTVAPMPEPPQVQPASPAPAMELPPETKRSGTPLPQMIANRRAVGAAQTDAPARRETEPGGDLTPDQAALADPDKWSLCGPVAAMAFARAHGRAPTIAEAKALARDVGWRPEAGMAGPASQVALLKAMGVASTLADAGAERVARDVQSGNPVIISTPQHYFVAEKYDPETGRFYFGKSGTVLSRTGGKAWMTLDEVRSVGRGIQGAIYMDNPATPAPSPTATGAPGEGKYRPLSATPVGGAPTPLPGDPEPQGDAPPVQWPEGGPLAPPQYPGFEPVSPLLQPPVIPPQMPPPLRPARPDQQGPAGRDIPLAEGNPGLYLDRQSLPPALRELMRFPDLMAAAAPDGWTADKPVPEGLDLALSAIPALPSVPGSIGVRGVGPGMAMAADVASGLLGGPSVTSLDDALRPLAQGVRMAGQSVADVLGEFEPRGPGTRSPDVPGYRSETLGVSVGAPPPGTSQRAAPTPSQPGRVVPPPAPDNVLGLRPISTGLTKRDQLTNSFKRTLGVGVEAEEHVTPAFRERARLQPVVESQAAALAEQASERTRRAFVTDAEGRIPALKDGAPGGLFPDGPTIQDVAARLPVYEALLTPEQRAALDWLRQAMHPYRALWDEVGAKALHSRMDVMDGGFYLPRMRAGERAGFWKPATYESQAAGIADGVQYASLHDSLQDHIKAAGNKIVDQHIANYLAAATDDSGRLLHTTMADRIDPQLRDLVTDLRSKIFARRHTLAAQNVRARMAGMSAEQAGRQAARAQEMLERAQLRFEARLAGQNTDAVVTAAERELKVLEREAGRRATAADAAEGMATRAEARATAAATKGKPTQAADAKHEVLAREAARDQKAAATARQRADAAQAKLDDAIAKNRPDAVTRAAQREAQVRRWEVENADARAKASGDRAAAYLADRDATQAELRQYTADLAALKGRWGHAQRVAATTPRGAGQIDLIPLQGKAFPDALADAANAELRAERPLQGKGTAPLRAVNALNNLYRSVGATADNSVLGIQGLLGLASDPSAYGKALKVNMQAWGRNGDRALGAFLVDFDDAARNAGMPQAGDWARAGLHVGGTNSEFAVAPGIGALGHQLNNAPVIRESGRAFGFFGDALRLEWAQDEVQGLLRSGRTIMELEASGELAAIAKAVNGATGWSPTKFANDWGEVAMFASRFFQSRLETVARAAKGLRPGATTEQRIARNSLLKLMAGGTLLTVAVNHARGEETDFRPYVTTDQGERRRNPNFLRIRNLAGQDWSVFGTWDSLLGMFLGAAAGDPLRAVRGVSSGSVKIAWDLITGKDAMGRPVPNSPSAIGQKPGDFAAWIARSFSPFSWQDLPELAGEGMEAAKAGNVAGMGATAAVAVGKQFLGVKGSEFGYSDTREQIARSRYGKPWDKLDQGERREVNKAAELQTLKEDFQPQDTGTMEQRAAAAFQRAVQQKAELEQGMRAKIDAGMTGKALRESIQEFKRDRFVASAALITPEIREATKRQNKPPQDVYAEEYWSIPLPVTLGVNGEDLDIDAQERGRLDVLQRAEADGVNLEYITGTGPKTFRGERFKDDAVRQAVEELEQDQKTLRTYWQLADRLQDNVPAYRDAVGKAEALPAGSAQRKMAESATAYRLYQRDLSDAREALRRRDPEIQAAGKRWGYFSSDVQPAGLQPLKPLKPLLPLRPLGGMSKEAERALAAAGSR